MSLKEYFEATKGLGVLATADKDGKVNTAVYSRPHFLGPDEDQVALIMLERLSYANLKSNPQASYLYHEEGGGYGGKRLVLTMMGEETDLAKIEPLRRRCIPKECPVTEEQPAHLVHFRIDEVRPLIGT
ncbi:MAG: pyridoxamine 5'-phosphate oxidase family protein [Pirellulales bacterium]|nr:pyridoxamine 5'-phosphate oxidase family protein [Pirellulales bacterium]